MLQGKDKPTFAPHEDSGDVVVVVNARHAEFTGRKWNNKLYKWHTGYAPACCLAGHEVHSS
jgi:large subunit ribosomal protein L13